MRTSYKKVFGDKELLESMFRLRRKGWTYMSLAIVYGVDFSSIYHECKKFNVKRSKKTVELSVKSVLDGLGIKAKKEKMYQDYLREAGYKPQEYFLTDIL